MYSEKSATGYVGIKNLGCICYMNALIQQLFMIKQFRNGILNAQDPKKGENGLEEDFLYQL